MLFMRDGKTWDLRIIEKPGPGANDLFFEFTDLATTQKERFLLVRMSSYDKEIICSRLILWYNDFLKSFRKKGLK